MKRIIVSLTACLVIFQIGLTAGQELLSPEELLDLSIEDFLNVEVISASKKSERLFTAPATVYVITTEEINRMGFQHLQDVLKYIPSVYLYNPQSWVWGGQRGLVSNFSQTLLLINGREVNNLIAQEGFISRQFATHNIDRVAVSHHDHEGVPGADSLGVANRQRLQIVIVAIGANQAHAGRLVEGEAELHLRRRADEGLVEVLDGLDEMRLPEDQIAPLGDIQTNCFEFHGGFHLRSSGTLLP